MFSVWVRTKSERFWVSNHATREEAEQEIETLCEEWAGTEEEQDVLDYEVIEFNQIQFNL